MSPFWGNFSTLKFEPTDFSKTTILLPGEIRSLCKNCILEILCYENLKFLSTYITFWMDHT